MIRNPKRTHKISCCSLDGAAKFNLSGEKSTTATESTETEIQCEKYIARAI